MAKEIAVVPFPAGRWQSLTLGLLWLGFVTYDDMARPQLAPLWRSISLLLLPGPALYLALRPAARADQ